MKYDFETVADQIDYGFGTDYREDTTVMAGAQLHVKTAPCIIEGLTGLVQSGLYGWTSSADPQYISAIVRWMRDVRNWEIQSDWIVPSYGTLQAMCACIRAFTEPGDGIIVQQPVYVLYERCISNCGRRLVDNTLIRTGDHYEMDFDDLDAKMADPKNKLMILCNPHNPLMDVWARADLEKVALLARKHGVLVIADEIFAEHAFADGSIAPYASIDAARDNCVVCTSLGKAFNFTGTSHANIIIPDEEIRRRYTLQRDSDHYGSLSPFMRVALLSAYTPEGKDWIDALMAFTRENEAVVRDFFGRYFPQVHICRHRAGTLLWADFRALGTEEEVLALFQAAGVEPDMGSKYGEPGRGYMRMQIGMPRSELTGALERIRIAAQQRGLL